MNTKQGLYLQSHLYLAPGIRGAGMQLDKNLWFLPALDLSGIFHTTSLIQYTNIILVITLIFFTEKIGNTLS